MKRKFRVIDGSLEPRVVSASQVEIAFGILDLNRARGGMVRIDCLFALAEHPGLPTPQVRIGALLRAIALRSSLADPEVAARLRDQTGRIAKVAFDIAVEMPEPSDLSAADGFDRTAFLQKMASRSLH